MPDKDFGFMEKLWGTRQQIRAVMAAYTKWVNAGVKPGKDKWIRGYGVYGEEWWDTVREEWLKQQTDKKVILKVMEDKYTCPISTYMATVMLGWWRRYKIPKRLAYYQQEGIMPPDPKKEKELEDEYERSEDDEHEPDDEPRLPGM